MPTESEREYYRMGFFDGMSASQGSKFGTRSPVSVFKGESIAFETADKTLGRKRKRKLSAWNKFVKANSKKKIYQYASGKLKLKKMGIAFRKKRR